MMLSAPHAAYVVAAYAASGVAILALVIETVLRAWRWRRRAEGDRRP